MFETILFSSSTIGVLIALAKINHSRLHDLPVNPLKPIGICLGTGLVLCLGLSVASTDVSVDGTVTEKLVYSKGFLGSRTLLTIEVSKDETILVETLGVLVGAQKGDRVRAYGSQYFTPALVEYKNVKNVEAPNGTK